MALLLELMALLLDFPNRRPPVLCKRQRAVTDVRGPSKRRERGKQIVETTTPVPSPDMAKAALDRIEISQDVVERISELLTPGSSLIISDYGISGETGKDTDFIVVTR